MNKKSLFALIGTIATLGCQVAIAENLPGAISVTLSEAYYHFDNQRDMENHTGMPNIALAYNVDAHWALEAGIGVLNAKRDDDANQDPDASVHGMLYTVDAIYRFMPERRFEPYVIWGIGVLGLKPNGDDNVQQGNFNAGVGAQYFVYPLIALRLEVRDILMTTGSGMNDYMVNAGVSFVLGGHQPVYKDETPVTQAKTAK